MRILPWDGRCMTFVERQNRCKMVALIAASCHSSNGIDYHATLQLQHPASVFLERRNEADTEKQRRTGLASQRHLMLSERLTTFDQWSEVS